MGPQFDWTHRFYHTNNWVAIAARHLIDELLLAANPIEFAIATNFVFETGFTNLQFVALSALARDAGDRMFETMVQEHPDRRGAPRPDRPRGARDPREERSRLRPVPGRQVVLAHLAAVRVLTGFSMDYLTPLAARRASFKEFMEEWIVDQFLEVLDEHGLARPWYWDTFTTSLDHYHHMVYASAYTYRATVWFDFVVPGPRRARVARAEVPALRGRRSRRSGSGSTRAGARATRISTSPCTARRSSRSATLCQFVLCDGTPARNSAETLVRGERKYIFCSEPCRWIFEREPERYAGHKDVVKRVLAGEAPANLAAILTQYFGLTQETWGRDAQGGRYDWLVRPAKPRPMLRGAAEAPDERRP